MNFPIAAEIFRADAEQLEKWFSGFSLFMLRAVLSGRGDEVIDLARVNLLR